MAILHQTPTRVHSDPDFDLPDVQVDPYPDHFADYGEWDDPDRCPLPPADDPIWHALEPDDPTPATEPSPEDRAWAARLLNGGGEPAVCTGPHNLLADWLDGEAAKLAPANDDRAEWLSGVLADLAGKARFLRAATPDDFDFRDEDNHLSLLDTRYDRWLQGRRRVRRRPVPRLRLPALTTFIGCSRPRGLPPRGPHHGELCS